MAAPAQGPGTFFDGTNGAAHDVTVTMEDAALVMSAADGTQLARWDYATLERLPAPEHRLRLAPAKGDSTARLEVRDPAFGEAVKERLGVRTVQVESSERVRRHHVMEWSLAAIVAVALIGLSGIPALTDMVLPLIPVSAEASVGAMLDRQKRAGFDEPGPFECGDLGPQERAGKAAFLKMLAKIEPAASLPFPLRPVVIRTRVVNAEATAGGYFYVYKGIIDDVDTADELGGVIAHELGHLAHRDFFRKFLHATGVSYMLVAVLSGGTGGGAALAAAQKLLVERYSRSQEAAADAFSVAVMRKIGANSHAIADLFESWMKNARPSRDMLLLQNHPADADRIAAVRATPPVPNPTPLLTAEEWAALRQVCSRK